MSFPIPSSSSSIHMLNEMPGSDFNGLAAAYFAGPLKMTGSEEELKRLEKTNSIENIKNVRFALFKFLNHSYSTYESKPLEYFMYGLNLCYIEYKEGKIHCMWMASELIDKFEKEGLTRATLSTSGQIGTFLAEDTAIGGLSQEIYKKLLKVSAPIFEELNKGVKKPTVEPKKESCTIS